MMAAKRLLFFSLEDWTEVRRRNQFFCTLLHDRHPDLEILWVGPAPYFHNRLKARRSEFELQPGPRAVEGYPRIHTLEPYKVMPNSFGRSINEAVLLRQTRQGMKHLGWSDCIVWVNNQAVRRLLPALPGTRTIYDITDDWTKCNIAARLARIVAEDDAWLLANADRVIACSQSLFDAKRERCRRLQLTKNGVEVERYGPAALASLLKAKPQPLLNVPQPIAGYTGTLHEDRLDVDLIAALCRLNSRWQFVFVGPDRLSSTSRKLLQTFANCHIVGSVPYSELPAYVACFDACITPHKVTEFTNSLDPLKLYEYMSTGKPIVASACAGFTDVGELVTVATGAEQFASALQASQTDPLQASKCEARLRWAEEQSWQARIIEIEEALQWSSPPNLPGHGRAIEAPKKFSEAR